MKWIRLEWVSHKFYLRCVWTNIAFGVSILLCADLWFWLCILGIEWMNAGVASLFVSGITFIALAEVFRWHFHE